jgi:hypothetical protein
MQNYPSSNNTQEQYVKQEELDSVTLPTMEPKTTPKVHNLRKKPRKVLTHYRKSRRPARKQSGNRKFLIDGSPTYHDKHSISSINVPEPALIEFTRDFPDWGLADIFIFLKTGQPKKDFTPSRRSNRPMLKNSNVEIDKRAISGE